MATWKIKDLKGVGDVELELDDSKRVFVFLGSNGVGKTKTLEALMMFLLRQTNNFVFFPDRSAAYQLPEQHAKRNFAEISKDKNRVDLNYDITDIKSIDFESFFSQVNSTCFSSLAYIGAQSRGVISKEVPFYAMKSMGSFESRRDKYFGYISQAISKNEISSLGVANDIQAWFVERAQSVNPYQKSKDNRKIDIDTVLNALNQLDNRIEKTLNVDGDNNVFFTVEGKERNLSQLSSGFTSIIKIIQSIIESFSAFTNETDLLNVRGVVLIDEIESHLHVEWQTKIIPTLKKLFPNTTFYIATHSPLVLSQLSQGEAYLLNRDDDGVVRSEKITNPSGRLFSSVLNDAFGIDLNKLKRSNMQFADQSEAKEKLLALLNETGE